MLPHFPLSVDPTFRGSLQNWGLLKVAPPPCHPPLVVVRPSKFPVSILFALYKKVVFVSLSLRLEHGTFDGADVQTFHDASLLGFYLSQCETWREGGRQCESRKQEVTLGWACILLPLSKEVCART